MFGRRSKTAVVDKARHTAGDMGSSAADTASDVAGRVVEVAGKAAGRTASAAREARKVAAPVVRHAAQNAAETLSDAAEKAAEILADTADRLAHVSAEHAEEATLLARHRLANASASLAEAVRPKPKRRLRKLLLVGAVVGAIVAVFKSPFRQKLTDKITEVCYGTSEADEPPPITLPDDAAASPEASGSVGATPAVGTDPGDPQEGHPESAAPNGATRGEKKAPHA